MYAGALGDNAVERYAMFLTSLELSADIAERRLALTRARDHGLDIERVAIVTAERTIEKAFSVRVPYRWTGQWSQWFRSSYPLREVRYPL